LAKRQSSQKSTDWLLVDMPCSRAAVVAAMATAATNLRQQAQRLLTSGCQLIA
jgi:hypothetical protein